MNQSLMIAIPRAMQITVSRARAGSNNNCHPRFSCAKTHLSTDGYAVMWGLGNKVRSAAECCRLCKEFNPKAKSVPHPCQIWIWCGEWNTHG